MNSRPIPQWRRHLPPIMAAMLAAAMTIPAAAAGDEPELVTALRAKGAQIVALGKRGGLAGYLVTPEGGAGYSLYVTGDGHGVAGLLYGPDGALLTAGQLAAMRGSPMTAASDPSVAVANAAAPVRPVNRAEVPRRRGFCGSPDLEGTGEIASSAPTTESAGAGELADNASGAVLLNRARSAFGFTLGEQGPRVVLFGDALCPWSRSAAARIGREAMAGKLRLHVVPVALLGAASARRAAGIAASANPAQAWFSRKEGPAGKDARNRIARNNALFDAWGERSVPLIAYRTKQGGIVHRVGDIADIGAWLRELDDE